MLWFDKLLQRLDRGQLQTVNDSKTPSGRVHVGALRGVLIHDAVYRMLKERDVPVRYLFGVDDYDPLDELPYGKNELFEKYLGMPLCQVPAPPDSPYSDMAEHYISEFFDIFKELGVGAETYRMRDIYRSGKFNEAIDAILSNAHIVREVYKEVSGAERPDYWYPFQVICQQCGRIGTTEVYNYQNGKVSYRCRPNLVKWATGCGNEGEVSPFDGNGKLVWKLEWVAKWKSFPVTIEGAGKDHTTKGGSRDVSAECLRRIFNQQPPLNIPYEFFLVGGAKMSSSKGIGVSAREMADFLPPEVLRFLVLRTKPNSPVDFKLGEDAVIKLFNDFDRFHYRTFHDDKISPDDKQVYLLSEVEPEGDYFTANFQLVMTVIQMPHLDLITEVEKRKGSTLTDIELKHLNARVQAARYWLDNYASEEEKLQLQEKMPERAAMLTATQRAFLHTLAALLPHSEWNEEALQATVFNAARLTPIDNPMAFKAIYRILLDRESGPKAGNLLAFLDTDFVIRRFQELDYSQIEFWQATAIQKEDFEKWLSENAANVQKAQAHWRQDSENFGVVELVVTLNDGKSYRKRVAVESTTDFETTAKTYVDSVATKYNLTLSH
jgi:lysyl-tRNA synthetase class 1